MRRVVWGLVTLAVGCATPPPPPVTQPLWKDGVMQKPLTVEEATRYLKQAAPEFSVCYRREQLNLTARTSDYLFQVFIPVDGSTPDVTVLKETVAGQLTLRDCLTQAIERVHFPAHTGQPLTLKVPIEGS
ncbi:MAG: hypothetical protein H6730_34705 [Deltaproteobacteria bacterium]|nr:hypothetical protein [Deltaproteobacteria bacterium]